MSNALIGYTGFVGGTLLNQVPPDFFDSLYRSSNITDIRNKEFDIVVCAGAPAQKWLANKEPYEDLKNIYSIISHLNTIKAKTFVLISTVDVYKSPIGVDEDDNIATDGLHPYGLHRLILEQFVQSKFENHLIMRLPGLVGNGLKKNVIYDLAHLNNIDLINGNGSYQYYPMQHLHYDITRMMANGNKIVNMSSEPILTSDIANDIFGIELNKNDAVGASYDMRSKHTGTGYWYSRNTIMHTINEYRESCEHLDI